MEDLLRAEGLVDLVAGGDEEGGTEEEKECGKGGRVEDTKKGDVGTMGGEVEVGETHCNDMTMDVLGMAGD